MENGRDWAPSSPRDGQGVQWGSGPRAQGAGLWSPLGVSQRCLGWSFSPRDEVDWLYLGLCHLRARRDCLLPPLASCCKPHEGLALGPISKYTREG
jgi:hypothetical protein